MESEPTNNNHSKRTRHHKWTLLIEKLQQLNTPESIMEEPHEHNNMQLYGCVPSYI